MAAQLVVVTSLSYKRHNPNLSICLIANKDDLARARIVTPEEGKSLANKFKIHYIESSTETEHNIDELMLWIVEQISDNLSGDSNSPSKGKSGIVNKMESYMKNLFKTRKTLSLDASMELNN